MLVVCLTNKASSARGSCCGGGSLNSDSAKRCSALWAIFVVLAGLTAGVAQPQVPAKTKQSSATHYEITGVVLNSVGGDPVPNCHLTVNLIGRGRSGGGSGGRVMGGFAGGAEHRFAESKFKEPPPQQEPRPGSA